MRLSRATQYWATYGLFIAASLAAGSVSRTELTAIFARCLAVYGGAASLLGALTLASLFRFADAASTHLALRRPGLAEGAPVLTPNPAPGLLYKLAVGQSGGLAAVAIGFWPFYPLAIMAFLCVTISVSAMAVINNQVLFWLMPRPPKDVVERFSIATAMRERIDELQEEIGGLRQESLHFGWGWHLPDYHELNGWLATHSTPPLYLDGSMFPVSKAVYGFPDAKAELEYWESALEEIVSSPIYYYRSTPFFTAEDWYIRVYSIFSLPVRFLAVAAPLALLAFLACAPISSRFAPEWWFALLDSNYTGTIFLLCSLWVQCVSQPFKRFES
jgi:hypothetical protein